MNPELSSPAGKRVQKQSGQVRKPSVWRRLARWLGGLTLGGGLVGAGLFAASHFWLFPWLGENREWVEAELSKVSGVPMSIDRLEADWQGIRPRLRLDGLRMQAGERAVLQLERVEATLAWSSLPRLMPYFHRLEIVGPEIELERGKDGVFTVAGIRIEPNAQSQGNPVAWLLGQSQVAVRDASLTWNDSLRGAPPLRLTGVQFSIERGLVLHRFELRAKPPEGLATALHVRGELSRYDADDPMGTVGRLYAGLDRADLGGWAAWVDYPIPCTGNGNVRLWLDSDGAGTAGASVDLGLSNVETTLGPDLVPLRIERLGGRVLARRTPKGVEFGARSLWLDTGDGVLLDPTDFDIALRQDADGAPSGGSFSASMIELAMLVRLAGNLPLSEELRARLADLDPHGRVRDISFGWEGESAAPREWTLKAHFDDIKLDARDAVPGMGGMSGWVDGNEQAGRYAISSRDGYVDLPRVFENSRLLFASLDAKGGWRRVGGRLEIAIDAADFANEDAAGTASGRYWPEEKVGEKGLGEIDITGRLSRAEGGAVWRYLPRIAGPNAYNWIKRSIRRADVSEARVEIKGPMSRFPFRNGEGKFLVAIQGSGGHLDYAPGWPSLDGLGLELRFEGPGLTINAQGGRIFDVQVEPVRVEIPDLGNAIMTITGTANGRSADFLRFLAESPLAERLHGFAGVLQAEGEGRLELKLTMPLADVSTTKVGGQYSFAGNRIRLSEGGPAVEAAEGRLGFTEESLEIPSIRGRLLGGAFALEGKTGETGLGLAARGQADLAAAREAFGGPLLAWMGGSMPWRAEMLFNRDSGRIAVRSGLKGLRSRLPEPFAKEADETWALEVVMLSRGPDKPKRLTAKLDGWVEAVLERDSAGNVRGGVGLNQPAPMGVGGVEVAATLSALDIDAWQWSMDAGEGEGEGEGEGNDRGGIGTLPVSGVTLNAGRVRAFGHVFKALKLRAKVDGERWTARLDSTEAKGDIIWRRVGEGLLSARLSRLMLSVEDSGHDESLTPPRSLPGLDVQAEAFAIGERELGQLEVRASNQKDAWRLDEFSIRHPAAQFHGRGIWQVAERYSSIDFTLDAVNIGDFAKTMGYPDMVKGGNAKLVGQLGWKGAPTRIDYPTLSGHLDLSARSGRFERLEPGVGRLLGILSLQALPRRVTLDFRDVFSEGFAFDRIDGKVIVTNGVMMSKEGIGIAGPAARVLMQGQADIAAETQDLRVNVRPTLSESVAIGAAVINPAAGAVTYLAQKVLGDPIEKLFSYNYKVTGNWVDPVVEKVVVPSMHGSTGEQNLLQNVQ